MLNSGLILYININNRSYNNNNKDLFSRNVTEEMVKVTCLSEDTLVEFMSMFQHSLIISGTSCNQK